MKPHIFDGSNLASAPSGRPQLAVVGAGIVGLSHAWAAARRGWHVRLFERHPRAEGASVRNFGMVWPIGQPHGVLHRVAMRSRELWVEAARSASFWTSTCGSLHLAYREDEYDVLEEFAELAPTLGYECELLSSSSIATRSPAARPDGMLGGLWSRSEMCVDPREVIARMPQWLHERYGVELHFDTPIREASSQLVIAADGSRWSADRVVIATGADLRLLFPNVYAQAGFRRCKLHMYRTAPQPRGWSLGPMIAGGLTLRHYDAFNICSALEALKRRIEAETPELNRFGIHVMASQNERGEVILGDSHEYGDDADPFDKSCIDDLIMRELRRMVDLPDWTIHERWHGVYPKAPGMVQFVAEPEPEVHISIASGGCGMTMSFGLADEQWTAWQGPVESIGPAKPSMRPAAAVSEDS